DHARIYRQTAAAVRISNFVCFPAFVIVFFLATPISALIYNAPGAGPAVMISAVSIILLGLHQVSTGVLQGLGHTTIPMVNMILAAVAKVVLNWTLTAMPAFGIMGAAWATAADMGVAAFINLYFIYKYIGYKIELSQLAKTIGAAAIMAVSVKLFYNFTIAEFNSGVLSTFGAVFVGGAIYIAAIALLGGLLKEDMERIPMIGKYGVKIFQRLGIFR
ncbi:MAG: polysaccharide biosynthesis C-terminal domain-containing protein, partial [Selenomonadaceae bacterium]|nr:polysaccharide biosynthesis C-terminal domain-containing protein [Selenomonadaceae bacterium]